MPLRKDLGGGRSVKVLLNENIKAEIMSSCGRVLMVMLQSPRIAELVTSSRTNSLTRVSPAWLEALSMPQYEDDVKEALSSPPRVG